MNLKNSMLSERSQKQKSTFYMIPLIWNFSTSKTNLWGQKSEQWSSMGIGNCLERGTRELSGVMERFCTVTGVLVTQMYIYATICQTVHLTPFCFPVYKFYLKKIECPLGFSLWFLFGFICFDYFVAIYIGKLDLQEKNGAHSQKCPPNTGQCLR